jgi:hypothetical protein
MSETGDEMWTETRWVERDGTGRTRSGVRRRIGIEEQARARPFTNACEKETEETWIGYAFRKLSRYAFIAPRHVSRREAARDPAP